MNPQNKLRRKSTSVTVRLEHADVERLAVMAARTGRSRNQLLTEATELYLAICEAGLMTAADPKLHDLRPASNRTAKGAA